MSMSETFCVPFYTLIKLCYTKALKWSSLVPGPKAKSLEITNPTFLTVSCQFHHINFYTKIPDTQYACMHIKFLQSYINLCNPINCGLPGSSCPWDSPGKSAGVGCHALLQGNFLTQGSNPHLLCLLHWKVGFLPLHHLGSPSIVLCK